MLIGVIVELWVLESAKVLVCEGIEATPMYYCILVQMYVRYHYACTCCLAQGTSYIVFACVVTKLCEEKELELC